MHHAAAGPRLPWTVLVVVLTLPWLVRLARRASPGRSSQVLAAGTLLVAAVLHVAAAAGHAGEQRIAFVLTAVLQLTLSGLVLTRPTPLLAAVTAVTTSLAVLAWLETRTAGLLYGVEPLGLLDGTCVAAEIMTLLACGALRRRCPDGLRLDGEVAGWALIVSAGALAAAA